MEARTTAHAFETCRVGARRRTCPGCGTEIDLSTYGCLWATATVACPNCGGELPLVDLD